MKSELKLKGRFRCKIGEIDKKTGKLVIVGNSGWGSNTFTGEGMENGIVSIWAQTTGSVFAQSMILGTQTNAIQSTQTALSGQGTNSNQWQSLSKSTLTATGPAGTFRMTGAFYGSVYTNNIAAVGVASASNASMLSGNTFSGGSSSFGVGQTASVTYEWQIS